MRILVSGSSGLIGTALLDHLRGRGHNVVRLTRAGGGDVVWDPAAGRIDPAALEGFDAVVHLAGENIAGRWTDARKNRIRDSRVAGTRLLAEALAGLRRPPAVLASASATGYYGNRNDETLDESSSPGEGFLAGVCVAWEDAARPAAAAGIRTALLRTGVVLTPAGGALGKIAAAVRAGLGGPLGRGTQYVSWISLDDEVRAIEHVLTTASLEGPVNLVAPGPVTNRELTEAIAKALSRPSFFSAPAFALRLALGEMADEVLLASTRVLPRRLLASGFQFSDAEIGSAVARLLKS